MLDLMLGNSTAILGAIIAILLGALGISSKLNSSKKKQIKELKKKNELDVQLAEQNLKNKIAETSNTLKVNNLNKSIRKFNKDNPDVKLTKHNTGTYTLTI